MKKTAFFFLGAIFLLAGHASNSHAERSYCIDSNGERIYSDLEDRYGQRQRDSGQPCLGAGSNAPSSHSGGATAQLLLQLAPLLGGMVSSDKSAREAKWAAQQQMYEQRLRASEQAVARKKEKARLEVEQLVARASYDASLDPWADKPIPSGSKDKPDAKKGNNNRAPYLKNNCVKIVMGGTGISDMLRKVHNGCGMPVQVQHCFFTPNESGSACGPQSQKTTVGWGVTDTIKPGGWLYASTAVDARTWRVRYYVCDMRDPSLLCLVPKP